MKKFKLENKILLSKHFLVNIKSGSKIVCFNKLQFNFQVKHPVHWPRPCVSNDAASAACWA